MVKLSNLKLLATGLAALAIGTTQAEPVHASDGALVIVSSIAEVTQSATPDCAMNFRSAARRTAVNIRQDASPMSALERMRHQQSGLTSPPAQPALTPSKTAPVVVRSASNFCIPKFSQKRSRSISDNFLASKRVRIESTRMDYKWHRVEQESISGLAKMAPVIGNTQRDTLEAVNRWANRSITYVRDRDLYGRADYWAGARMTLMLGKGDCEDIALVKMQMLAASGFSREDMFLSIVRDRIRQIDHAVLAVRTDEGFVVLDNATDVVLNGDLSHDYVPVISFNSDSSWVHGV